LNEVIEITLTENINSNSNKINIKMPLAISLLDRKKGEIVKFQNDNAEEIYIEILEVKSK
jgi:transcription elongation GreA/GreB family factor